ncbi:uncharacterized protein LOC127868756 [Dreissena polymorpha]|uniref:protein acetyllysine N-acetyltransferase n=1 Tax=Dreissena polymorpha TaxID=45954 RepID=A0A9D4M9Z6_DREPO|nr:uncharacterized protein LOC127868756 [Dreissena polymorpha]KAH3872391.1 hypothetical protein DPMN_035607 [Dreissena polymorpha]
MSDKDRSGQVIQKSPISTRKAKKLLYLSEYLLKQESKNNSKKVSRILKKHEHERTESEKEHLANHQDIVKRIRKNREKKKISELRNQETEDNEEELQRKCDQLADILKKSKKTVIYTGAGISTAASIPDYRGPQGVWTLLKKGEEISPQDLSDAEPTLTHMCITELHKKGHVKHVVSQNCDGLHLRSGLPRQTLSEVHGNMFIEICYQCKRHREYLRLFDVTENTGVRRHSTGRKCHFCDGDLKDTIVHFGEKGGLKSPYHWKEAVRAANRCDVILCLGSSLKILKKYSCLWCMERAKHKRPKLVIVNLQWTPKDESATLKINGKCDVVMDRVMRRMGYEVPQYVRTEDPIYQLATPLRPCEEDTTSKKILQCPEPVTSGHEHGISRTPTPSDSSSDSTDETESDNDNCDDDEDDVQNCDVNRMKSVSSQQKSSKRALRKSIKLEIKMDQDSNDDSCGEKSSGERSLSKSQKICNEAKIAMQAKLVNAKINQIHANSGNAASSSQDAKITHLHGELQGICSNMGMEPMMKYDPLKGGPFDPGPTPLHEGKVAYLYMLHKQLEVLKEKQKVLKEQELSKFKTKRLSNEIKSGSESKKSSSFVPNALPDAKCLNLASPTSGACNIMLSVPNLTHDVERIKANIKTLQHEQRILQEQRAQVQRKYADYDHLMKKKHQDEQLRLHQHFLIQEQLLSQTADGMAKKEDMLKLFVYQQQILIAQQNTQLMEVVQSHSREIQELDVALAQKHGELMSETKHLTECQNRLNLSVLQQANVEASNLGPMQSPTKKDFSILSILTDSDTEAQNSNIPSVAALLNTMLTCDSCKFLKNYGVFKKKCQNCQLLKAKNGCATVSSLSSCSPSTSRNVKAKLKKELAEINVETWPIGSGKHSEEKPTSLKSSISTSTSNPSSSQGYSRTDMITMQQLSQASSVKKASSVRKYKTQPSATEPPEKTPKSNTICETPLNSKRNERCSSNVLSHEQMTEEHVLLIRNQCVTKNNSVEQIEKTNQPVSLTALKPVLKPVRSHSQSEIYDSLQEDDTNDRSGFRHIRSLSHSEGTNVGYSDLQLTPARSADDSRDSTTLDALGSGKKRKINKSLSVPGWFGKGLNIKKKRKY